MTAAASSPYVAFGLRAMAVAMKAKLGKRVNLADIAELAQMQVQLLPDDGDAARAVTRFLARWADDQVSAGAGLQAFLAEWRRGELADVTERTAAAVTHFDGAAPEGLDAPIRPPPATETHTTSPAPHAWQHRADAGLD